MSAEREHRIRVVCRVRPLNDREEKVGSEAIVFPGSHDENSLSIKVSYIINYAAIIKFVILGL